MQNVYVALAAGLMLCWLMLAALGPRKADTPNALAVLRYGVILRSLALAFALMPPMMMLYAVWAFLWQTPATLNFAGVLFLAFSAIAGLLLIEVTRVQIVVTEEGITRFSPWSGLATLKWIDVERVRYSSVNQWFVVESAGGLIRISRHLEGIGEFAGTLKRKVAGERWASAASALAAAK